MKKKTFILWNSMNLIGNALKSCIECDITTTMDIRKKKIIKHFTIHNNMFSLNVYFKWLNVMC